MPGHAHGAVITHTRVHPRRVGKYRAGHVALLGVLAGPAAGPRSGPGRGRARPAGRAPSAESASPHQKTVRDRDFQILCLTELLHHEQLSGRSVENARVHISLERVHI